MCSCSCCSSGTCCAPCYVQSVLLCSPYISSHYGQIAQLIREVKYVLLQKLWTVRSRRGLFYLADRMLLSIVKTSRLRVPMIIMVSLDVTIKLADH